MSLKKWGVPYNYKPPNVVFGAIEPRYTTGRTSEKSLSRPGFDWSTCPRQPSRNAEVARQERKEREKNNTPEADDSTNE